MTMMTALATVVHVQHSGPGFRVELSCEQKTSCSHCASSSSCSTGIVSKAVGNKKLIWYLDTQEPVIPGQMVEIGFPEKSLLQSALLVYFLPLVMLLFGAFVGEYFVLPRLNGGEGIVILTAVIFVLSGVLIAKFLARQLESRTEKEVILLRVLGESVL